MKVYGGMSARRTDSDLREFATSGTSAVYMSLQGSINAKQGSGIFVIGGVGGDVSGGGTFTMTG
jgi:hypothetical protein